MPRRDQFSGCRALWSKSGHSTHVRNGDELSCECLDVKREVFEVHRQRNGGLVVDDSLQPPLSSISESKLSPQKSIGEKADSQDAL